MVQSRLTRMILLVILFTSAISGCSPKPVQKMNAVTVQLKWVHQAQFAGFYVAADQGFYKAENININLIPGGVGINIMDAVTGGQAQFGVTGPEQIIIARDQGRPVKAIATIFRINPFVLAVLPESGIHKPADLIGKTVNIGGVDGFIQFTAMMSKLNLDIRKIDIVPYSYDVAPFYDGQISAEPANAAGSLIPILQKRSDVKLIWPDDYGIHFYSDTLFTTDQLIAQDPDLVLRFLRATLKGEQYAVANPDEAVKSTLKYAQNPDPVIQNQMMIASIPLINTGEDQVGWMKPEIWSGMGAILREQGLISKPVDGSQVFTMQFLNQVYGK
jgi:NitT/TauT family transport system substrate-binding protein